MPGSLLPHINGALNSLTIVLLLAAYAAIRQRNLLWHRRWMVAALGVSAVFLASYLVHHFSAPIFQFRGEGWIRPVYYTLLIVHVLLAIVATPLVLLTAWRGIKQYRFLSDAGDAQAPMEDPDDGGRHRRLARWVWPLWMVVAVTGVLVYAMLYHLYPGDSA